MILRLVLLFTVVPALELFLLLQIGAWLGPWPTFLLLVGTGVVGAALARAQGFAVLGRLLEEARQGIPPGERLVEAALVLVGGLLLITPGVLTDVAGLLLLLPPVRRALAPRVLVALAERATVHGSVVTFGTPVQPGYDPGPVVGPSRPPGESKNPFDHPVAR